MIFVIAGNQEQAYQYINRKIEERVKNGEEVSKINDYKYVYDVTTLRGIHNPRGVFIGTWKKRKDIFDIVSTLRQNCNPPNKALIKIWQDLTIEDNKTDWSQVYNGEISMAAKMLSDAIDAEVLHKMIKNTMET